MQFRFPRLKLVDRRQLVWRGPIEPLIGGTVFTIEVHARGDSVIVRDPVLVSDPVTGRPPHTFPRDGSLCLHHVADRSLHPGDLLADTVVPWACHWGLYYDLWLLTGIWHGPEYPHHPDTAKT